MSRKSFLFAMSFVLLSGCATQAIQKNRQQIAEASKATEEQVACLEKEWTEDVTSRFRAVGIVTIDKITIREKMIDEYLPSDIKEEFLELLKKQSVCTSKYVARVGAVLPLHGVAIRNMFSEVDNINIKLLKDEVTIGQASSLWEEVYNSFMMEFHTIDANYVNAINQQHFGEVSARQRAAAQFQQQMLKQQQLNALQQPTITNCHMLGNNLTCTSR